LNLCLQLGGLIGFLGLKITGNPLLPPRRHQPPLFTIYTDPPESDTEPLELLLGTQLLESLLGTQPPEPLLDSEPLDSRDESQYQPLFLPKDRAGKPQNLPGDLGPLQLFQLFFTVNEIEAIVKHTNYQAAYIGLIATWKPLTVREAYQYLGCLVYIGVQPLQELQDYWHLKTPIASYFTWWRFKQIRGAFTIRDPQLSPEQPGDPWWFRLKPLATTIQKSCQQYWAPGAYLAIDESMIPYFGHTQHSIKAPHKPISQVLQPTYDLRHQNPARREGTAENHMVYVRV
jgi:hypothetical protein